MARGWHGCMGGWARATHGACLRACMHRCSPTAAHLLGDLPAPVRGLQQQLVDDLHDVILEEELEDLAAILVAPDQVLADRSDCLHDQRLVGLSNDGVLQQHVIQRLELIEREPLPAARPSLDLGCSRGGEQLGPEIALEERAAACHADGLLSEALGSPLARRALS